MAMAPIRVPLAIALLVACLLAPPRASADDVGGADVLTEALERVVDLYWRPEEVHLHELLAAGLQRLERAGDRVLVTGPDDDGVVRVAVGDDTREFATRDAASVEVVVARMRAGMSFVGDTLARTADPDDVPDLEVLALQGLLQPLDRHCRVIDESKLVDFNARYRGTLSGIGAKMGRRGEVLTVVKVYEGTPADRAHLVKGDVITHINGISTLNMVVSDAIAMIRGPEGQAVTLTVRRPGEDGARTFYIVREKVVLPTIDYRLVDERYALLVLDHFSQQTSQEFKRDLMLLAEQADGELGGVIIDLRGNQGGSMLHASWIVDYFVDDGEILRTEGPAGLAVAGLRHRVLADPDKTIAPWPVVVLVDGKTASGSEILAGGLKFLDRALVIGTQTYGKGTVQKPYELREQLQMKLTVARYLVADGVWLSDVGITPDLVLGEVFIDDDEVVIPDVLLDPDAPRPLPHADWQPTRDGLNAQGVYHLLYPYPAWAGDGYYEPGAGEADPITRERTWQPDLATVLATRILGVTRGVDRDALLTAARAVVEAERLRQQARLVDAMAELGVPWSPAHGDWVDGSPRREVADLQALRGPSADHLEVELDVGDLHAGEVADVVLRVTNRSDAPVQHLRAGLLSELRTLDGLGFLLGDIEPWATATAIASVTVSPRVRSRVDDVRIVLLDDSGPLGGPVATRVVTRGTSLPVYAFRAAPSVEVLEDGTRVVGFEVTVRNDSEVASGRVRVSFENPGREKVELQESHQEIGGLDPGESATTTLRVRFEPGAAPLKMQLSAEDRDYQVGTSVGFEVDPDDPRCREDWYRPPEIALVTGEEALSGEGTLEVRAEARDDEGMDVVVVWLGGDKIQIVEPAAGRPRSIDVRSELVLEPGINTLKLVAVDATGIRAQRRYAVLGR